MPTAIRGSDKLISDAKLISKVEKRSLTGQIEYLAQIGKLAGENPDLPYSLIREIMIGLEELDQKKGSEYQFEK
ncbi:MAG: TA system antitoxin ParD family protein [Bacteroidales bacterium]